MPLEDHPGDIVRKARQIAGLDIETAARSTALAIEDYKSWENSGCVDSQMDLATLAKIVGLLPERLERIARGWHPAPISLERWRELRVITTTRGDSLSPIGGEGQGVGALNTVHCYLVWDEVTREAALFDTGWEWAPIEAHIREHSLRLSHLFLTHTHEDHIALLPELRSRFPQLRVHTNSRNAPLPQRNRPNDFIHLGSLRIIHRDTPGHADDGVTYIVGNWPDDAPHVAMVGDTLFAGSMAQPFVSALQLKQSIREMILTLPPTSLLCPGHGPLTTVAEEKAHNPFFG